MAPSYSVSLLKYQSKNMLSTMPAEGMLGVIVPARNGAVQGHQYIHHSLRHN
jgi:hypothetical protein